MLGLLELSHKQTQHHVEFVKLLLDKLKFIVYLQVVKKVKVRVKFPEDSWATRLVNFITGVNQLLFEGLTRELPM